VLVCALKFTVIVPPGALTDEGAKLAFRETLPVSPPSNVTVIVAVGFVPGGRLTVVGDTEIKKVGA
jgi:hypothetical protein